jgi:hypothetical protein
VRKKCVGYSYAKGKKKLMIVLKKYCTGVDRLFVFQYFSNVFKGGFYKVKESSLGLAERGKVSKKERVASKEACKL